ncbi:MAG: arginine--tRNA ligase [Candidatus Hadarchaeota archaeon]
MLMTADPWGSFREDVCRALELAISEIKWKSPVPVRTTVEEPPDQKLGDLASTICFELAKSLHKSPLWIASEVQKVLKPAGLISRVEITGHYLNFFVDMPKLAALTLESIEQKKEGYGRAKPGNKKVVVEHTSINPTKPLHIGHCRNAVLGDTMARILQAAGYRVEIHNYIDDMGRQVAETLLAHRLAKRKPRAKFDHMLGLIYAEMHKRLETEPELDKKVKKILAELEMKGKNVSTAKNLAERCVKANLETTDRMGVTYDLLVWESDIVRAGLLEESLEKLKRAKRLVEGVGERAGTLVLKLDDFGVEDKVLVRSDGTAVYTARDISYQLWKLGEAGKGLKFKLHSRRADGRKTYSTAKRGGTAADFGHADIVVNVVGAEQRFPQKVVFAALRALGLEEAHKNSRHLAYEHVWLPSGRFSGRKGTWVGFSVDDVLEEAAARAMVVVKEHAPKESAAFWKKAAEFVGVGAVRYSMLSTSAEKKIVFKWEDALNFDRNSGPAIQYSHARACSILRKSKRKGGKHPDEIFRLPQEQRLLKLLSRFPGVVREAGDGLQPHLLALYASELALAFNTFYEAAPVIEAESQELKAARLRLVNCVRLVLQNALGIMGMVAPERM